MHPMEFKFIDEFNEKHFIDEKKSNPNSNTHASCHVQMM